MKQISQSPDPKAAVNLFDENDCKKIKDRGNIQSRIGVLLCPKAGPDKEVMEKEGGKEMD